MKDLEFILHTRQLIDSLKNVCANFGLGNSAGEFDIISQVFLYKFLNDKFTYEAKKVPGFNLEGTTNFQNAFEKLSEEEIALFHILIAPGTPKLKPHQTASFLHNRKNEDDFAALFDDTLQQIGSENTAIYSIKAASGAKDAIFDRLSQIIRDPSQRDPFCRALISKLFEISFEGMFQEKYDFFATIFEYLIKDYNSDSGGKYAEYYTPHAVARIMAKILVNEPVQNATVYDPSAGSGTLLMTIAHTIGENNCTIYSEDISQKSSNMLRLNLVLNNLSHSIPNVIKANTLKDSYYLNERFDYIVSNPPFKLDFSDFRADLDKDSNQKRFFAGIPKVPANKKESMAIYLLFIQHIMYSLSETGKAAIVVPTGFLTAQSGIEKTIREQLVERGWLRGVVSMPSNIFASTGTNVSVVFMDKEADTEHIILVDASKLGETIKEGKSQRTVLTRVEEQRIIDAMNDKKAEEDFSVVVSKTELKDKNYSFSAGQYFEVRVDYVDISPDQFNERIKLTSSKLESLFDQSSKEESKLMSNLRMLIYENPESL